LGEEISKIIFIMNESEFLHAIERQSYTTDDLYSIWFANIKDFLLDNITKSFNGVWIMDILAGMDLKRRPSVTAMLTICSRFYTNADILRTFYESQPDRDKKIIGEAVWCVSLS
jgi:hypothetical protein